MESPLFTVDGMFHGPTWFAIEDLLHHVMIDSDGRLLVAMIDVLAGPSAPVATIHAMSFASFVGQQ